ncbi:MAG: DUF3334 family protein [Desulfobacterales bacterium]|nr:DUF3334 family protein [Desulfobacterales bacterium]
MTTTAKKGSTVTKKSKTTDDVLKILCKSTKKVLELTTKTEINFSPIIQKTSKTCLKPDIGCFVLFDGGFSGLVIINFSADSAVEIYKKYMMSMGLPENELASLHTSDEVADSLGELMNQIIGDFRVELERTLRVSVNQNQPKMIVINKELMVSIAAAIDRPLFSRISFKTSSGYPFYMETAIENTKFTQLFSFVQEDEETIDPDQIMADFKANGSKKAPEPDTSAVDDDFMKNLGL